MPLSGPRRPAGRSQDSADETAGLDDSDDLPLSPDDEMPLIPDEERVINVPS